MAGSEKNKLHSKAYKRHRQKLLILEIFVIAAVFITITLYGGVITGSLFLVTAYILHEVLASDHLFYRPSSDYQYQFKADYSQKVSLDRLSADNPVDCTTWLLSLKVKATPTGRWFDPYVCIANGKYAHRQYFERSVNGLRYLNLSNFADDINNTTPLSISFKYCLTPGTEAELLGFVHPDYSRKRLLIISPHADDAEIAAFGLYSQSHDVHIITLTAGEVEMEHYQHIYEHPEQASRLKGRLRALDSIAVPLWGKVPQENCINLGYFCKRLPDMHKEPDSPIPSLTASLTDTRLFREYNKRELASDKDGQPTWKNLVQDLIELINEIQPEVVITPLTELDKHPDHIYATKALYEALTKTKVSPEAILHYANHYHATDMFPFGPEHTIAGLPPCIEGNTPITGVASWPLTLEQQKDKVYALEMMHDLKRTQKLKRRIRAQLQRLVGRRPNRYGAEGYFRKAIKSNELFFTRSPQKLQRP